MTNTAKHPNLTLGISNLFSFSFVVFCFFIGYFQFRITDLWGVVIFAGAAIIAGLIQHFTKTEIANVLVIIMLSLVIAGLSVIYKPADTSWTMYIDGVVQTKDGPATVSAIRNSYPNLEACYQGTTGLTVNGTVVEKFNCGQGCIKNPSNYNSSKISCDKVCSSDRLCNWSPIPR